MRRPLLSWFLVMAVGGPAAAQPADASRGQLLYATHCVECHTTQMHWRARRQVRDWDSLTAQVRRWQGEARLQWTEQDIEAVARHLNATIYPLPRPQQVGQAAQPRRRDGGKEPAMSHANAPRPRRRPVAVKRA
jgi:mono/diheme cytochrome c family protein